MTIQELKDLEFKSESDYKKYVGLLKSLAKDESQFNHERHINILKTNQHVYGLVMKDVRAVSKAISKGNWQAFLKIAKDDSYEEVLIQGIVVALIKDLDKQISLYERWVKKIDCWASCDSVCGSMKLLKKSKDKAKYFNYFASLTFSGKEFVARFGIITLMTCYMEEEWIDGIFNICLNVEHEGYYVKMAVAWLVSEGFVKFRDKTLGLLRQKGLDQFTQNKAISKCRDSFRVSKEDKELLLKYKI